MEKYKWSEAILASTNGGLDIIKHYYPAADESRLNKHFKIRDEKTASASLKQYGNGTWVVADWGNWEKPKNAFGVAMHEEGCNFGEACKIIAVRHNVTYDGKTAERKLAFSKTSAKKGEKNGYRPPVFNDKISDADLKVIGASVSNDTCEKFDFKSVKYYEYVKDGNVLRYESTPEYPIFAFADKHPPINGEDGGEWFKLYQPYAKEKKNRFRYIGGKPLNHVFGLEQLTRAYNEAVKEQDAVLKKDNKKVPPFKLKEVIIISGDRDALNAASFGYHVIWLNSESAELPPALFWKLKKMVHNIYILPDIDSTGVKQGRKNAFKYLALRVIWLPVELKEKKDHRGNPCSDFTDYVYHFCRPAGGKKNFYEFTKLVENALPMKFWEEYWDDKKNKIIYNFQISASHHFLSHKGFSRFITDEEKQEYEFNYVEKNIVKRTSPVGIENYIRAWMEKEMLPIPLRDMILKTPYLKEATLAKLKEKEFDFTNNTKTQQFWFFENFVLEINKAEIKTYKHGEIDRYVRKEALINHSVTKKDFLEEAPFAIIKETQAELDNEENTSTDQQPSEHSVFDIKINDPDNDFLNFLINTSRMFWRKDLELANKKLTSSEIKAYQKKHKFDIAGPNLSPEEIQEQKDHLVNKIYAFGYMVHRYKNAAKAWFAYGIDNKLSEDGKSEGGSGKSIFMDALEHLLPNRKVIDGSNDKLNPEFLLDGVTESTSYIYVDDMHRYFNFRIFYSPITNSMAVNTKQVSAFGLPFGLSPKLCGTSNFPPPDLALSTRRRILFIINSDYYHENAGKEYEQTRTVADDFGGNQLFGDFDEKQWNKFYNFAAYALQFYLSQDKKINPPMGNIKRRELLAAMGDALKDWCEVFFSKLSENLDKEHVKKDLHKLFKDEKANKMSSRKFKAGLRAFAEYYGYNFNPKSLHNTEDRILKVFYQPDGSRKTEEVIYIETYQGELERKKIENQKKYANVKETPQEPQDLPEDELPF